MDPQLQQLVDRISQAQNVLVTVSANPSVDQLAAAIGLTLALNKLDKHGTAVFSGQVPSTLEFLKPEETLESNTDSLRDFIIALDKSKADKLRYKVEDEVVRIFITPYRTSLSEKDLEFSQGDFNVDVVVCLGVTEQQDLDAAITAHGRILHDATVVSVSTEGQGSLGSIAWVDPNASSLSEMVTALSTGLDAKVLDAQIATALLTGIVAATERFRNDKTSPKTMSVSSELMAAGANQQLIATELEAVPPASETAPAPELPGSDDDSSGSEEESGNLGTLEIDHDAAQLPLSPESELKPSEEPPQVDAEDAQPLDGQDLDSPETAAEEPAPEDSPSASRERIVEPPQNYRDLTANTRPEPLDPPTEELTLPPVETPMLSRQASEMPPVQQPLPEPPVAPTPEPAPAYVPPTPSERPAPFAPPASEQLPPPPITPDETLRQIEEAVDSPHLHQPPAAEPAPEAAEQPHDNAIQAALDAVEAARQSSPEPSPGPIAGLNATPLGPELHAPAPPPVPNLGFSEPTPGTSPDSETLDMPLPPANFQATAPADPMAPPPFPPAPPSAFPGTPPQNGAQGDNEATPPPPVPPPMFPPPPSQ